MDLFEQLLPPVKSTLINKPEHLPQPTKHETTISSNPEVIDLVSSPEKKENTADFLAKLWDKIDNDSDQIVLTTNNKRNSDEQPGAGLAKRPRHDIRTGMQSRLIFKEAFQNRDTVINDLREVEPVQMEEEEAVHKSEVYAQYRPAKMAQGSTHPYPVVESSSLSSVEPPNIRYNAMLPSKLAETGLLSIVQLESVYYACQRHQQILPSGMRAGYFIGDGAGVGKGRTLAAIIYENFLHQRKRALWISVSNDLRHDAERDIRDLGAHRLMPVTPLNKMKYTKISSRQNNGHNKGVLYCTYSSLIGECQPSQTKSRKSAGDITYKTRFKQIINWFGKKHDGVIVFDECHKAKNLMPQGSQKKTKTAKLVLDLQDALPQARVVYASATGASEPRNMAYMTRLGLWGKGTPFPKFEDFVEKLEDKVGAMELIAVDMKQRGMYIARQLSFANVKFRVHEVKLDGVKLGQYDFLHVYDESVKLWNTIHSEVSAVIQMRATEIGEMKLSKTIWGQYWAAHQRFFKYLIMAGKELACVELTMKAISDNKCVVIGLQSTGEAKTNELLEENDGELDTFVSLCSGIMQTFVERFFPTRRNLLCLQRGGSTAVAAAKAAARKSLSLKDALPKKFLKEIEDSESETDSSSDEDNTDADIDQKLVAIVKNDFDYSDDDDDMEGLEMNNGVSVGQWKSEHEVTDAQKELLKAVDILSFKLPTNTLDALIRDLGGPQFVAEMTGRKGRMIEDEETRAISYQQRREMDVAMDQVNLVEKERFNQCEKLVAIISDAASTGISLHADRRFNNNRQRVHITLELPWSADRAIQQFGRTHRSNQTCPPEYVFLISDLAGERRFASTVAKRLESLGALTHGDRRATESRDLSQFNIDNKFGRQALELVFDRAFKNRSSRVPVPRMLQAHHAIQIQMEKVGLLYKDCKNVSKFLNRILGMPLQIQNSIFEYYTETMDDLVKEAKRHQQFDHGIIDLVKDDDNVYMEETICYKMQFLGDDVKVELHKVKSITGMDWITAWGLWSKHEGRHLCGFYLNRNNQQRKIALIIRSDDGEDSDSVDTKLSQKNSKATYIVYSPTLGEQKTRLDERALNAGYSRLESLEDAKIMWELVYSVTETQCLHYYWSGSCTRPNCTTGCRSKIRYVLSGSIFYIWDQICLLQSTPQLARVRLCNGNKIIGCIISSSKKDKMVEVLKSRDLSQYTSASARVKNDPGHSSPRGFVNSSSIFGPQNGTGSSAGLLDHLMQKNQNFPSPHLRNRGTSNLQQHQPRNSGRPQLLDASEFAKFRASSSTQSFQTALQQSPSVAYSQQNQLSSLHTPNHMGSIPKPRLINQNRLQSQFNRQQPPTQMSNQLQPQRQPDNRQQAPLQMDNRLQPQHQPDNRLQPQRQPDHRQQAPSPMDNRLQPQRQPDNRQQVPSPMDNRLQPQRQPDNRRQALPQMDNRLQPQRQPDNRQQVPSPMDNRLQPQPQIVNRHQLRPQMVNRHQLRPQMVNSQQLRHQMINRPQAPPPMGNWIQPQLQSDNRQQAPNQIINQQHPPTQMVNRQQPRPQMVNIQQMPPYIVNRQQIQPKIISQPINRQQSQQNEPAIIRIPQKIQCQSPKIIASTSNTGSGPHFVIPSSNNIRIIPQPGSQSTGVSAIRPIRTLSVKGLNNVTQIFSTLQEKPETQI